ncbi:hypothetical protein Aple_023360 [Acrocarpospora pleiomorpha]|uniref:Uncharacterized protein n=1 Tax=Acrocarpospora pleiomorpha TaxID=90975 RepID=A0A5M3XEE3_9ACTN|nr:hypothetical protein Aple_023360 [Acrocarpospora pleiomorpha]
MWRVSGQIGVEHLDRAESGDPAEQIELSRHAVPRGLIGDPGEHLHGDLPSVVPYGEKDDTLAARAQPSEHPVSSDPFRIP